MKNHPVRKEKVLLKVRKFNALIVEVWGTLLKIVLVPKMPKSLFKQHEVIMILKRVIP